MKLNNKKIILGISGGIAAYKCVELVRLLRAEGASVTVVMTESAKKFITPLTLQAVSGEPVRDDLFDLNAENAMGHIELARSADLIVVAPATANVIAELAYGLSKDLLTTLCLATSAPIAVVPAMNQQMWHNFAAQKNIQTLKAHQFKIWGPASGEQACGDVGFGRMIEPAEIVAHICLHWKNKTLTGKKVLITAGPTREAVDPVRCFTNYSTGKMGYALTDAATAHGASVVLISGPVDLVAPIDVKLISVETALEMDQAVQDNLNGADIFIGAAAVADYRPIEVKSKKIKKSADSMTINMVANPDIIVNVSNSKRRPALVVGFAAETNDVIEHAKNKLSQKNLDMIIANQVGHGKGFGEVESAVNIIMHEGSINKIPAMPKSKLAMEIIDILSKKLNSL